MIKFAVITGARSFEGNLSDSIGLWGTKKYGWVVSLQDPGVLGLEEEDGPYSSVESKTVVFHVGELLVLDDDDREIGYPGRAPYKWGIEFETFHDLEQAAARAQEVTLDYYAREDLKHG